LWRFGAERNWAEEPAYHSIDKRGAQAVKTSEIFGIVVRSIGLLVLLAAGWLLVAAALVWSPEAVIPSAIAVCVGFWLLGGAASLVRFAYPEEAPRPSGRPAAAQIADAELSSR
jgi:hypothetical protein